MSPDHKKEKNAFNNFIKINKIFLRELSKSKVKKLIYLSSVQVYGNKIKDEINENKKVIPDNNYSKSKIISEGLITLDKATIFPFGCFFLDPPCWPEDLYLLKTGCLLKTCNRPQDL